MEKKNVVLRALKEAFPHTIPIFAGFWFLGITYGIYARTSGLEVWYPIFMAIIIFGGSLEFVCVSMLLGAFAPLQTFIVAIAVQARHLFYGISMLGKMKNMGIKKWYLIFAMCDETFSINYSTDLPADVDQGWFMFWVTFLNESYWITGTTIGALLGSIIPFNTEGLDFAMTALFLVIFLEQVLKEKNHTSAVTGLLITTLCLVIFGSDSFLIPSMIGILAVLTILRGPLEKKLETEDQAAAK